MAWAVWDKALRPGLQEKLAPVWAPIEEERKLNSLLAQAAIISKADRAILAAFHNGTVDHAGYHLQRMTTINQFVAEGCQPMPHPIKDLPIGRIMIEMDAMLESGTWTPIERRKGLPGLCVAHLDRNEIHFMANRLVLIGNLPVGIISLQYTNKRRAYFECRRSASQMNVLNDIYSQVCDVMRRRVIRPDLQTRARLAVLRVMEATKVVRRSR